LSADIKFICTGFRIRKKVSIWGVFLFCFILASTNKIYIHEQRTYIMSILQHQTSNNFVKLIGKTNKHDILEHSNTV